MNTFLPSPDFVTSASRLDRSRLGKQRVECYQILRTLRGQSSGWLHHPAVKMWRGHEAALCLYALAMCAEWRGRGYRDNLQPVFQQALAELGDDTGMPEWLGDDRLHSSHRSNLLRKMPSWYGQFGWKEPATLPYWWPGAVVE